jgi:general secretion pathway protein D
MYKSLAAIFAAIILVGTLPMAPQAVAQSPSAQTYTFVFRNADIPQVAEEILGTTLGLSYRVEDGVAGKINLRIDQRLTKAQLLAALESALANYDVVMVREGETLVLRPRDKAQVGGQIQTGASPATTIGYQIRAVPLNYGSAEEIAKILETVTRSKLVLFASDKLGLIMLGGRNEELENAVSTISLFDQSSLSNARIRFFPLSNATAAAVAQDLERVLKASGTSSVTVLPMSRLNGVFAFSKSSQALDEASGWVSRLDVPSNDPSVRVWIYRPRGASAESLARTLNLVMGNGGEASSATTATSGTATGNATNAAPAETGPAVSVSSSQDALVRIVADKDTNTIIVNAPEATRVKLMDVINQLDREPQQVFIEASILEVTLTNDFNYGVDWKKIADGGDLTLSSYSSASTGFPSAAPGFTVNYVGTDITAAVRALSAKSNVRIVSAPKITTIENATARLQVGDQVPIVTQTAQSTSTGNAPLVNTVDYRDTGVKLEVTPRISGDNRVSLLVTQEVSSVARTQTSGIDSPTIKQRLMESQLVVPEGTVVALGGLINSSNSDSDGGVPFIKDVPLVGALFKGRQMNRDRTELVVLIQVKILRDSAAYDSLLSSLGADLRDNLGEGSWLSRGPGVSVQ